MNDCPRFPLLISFAALSVLLPNCCIIFLFHFFFSFFQFFSCFFILFFVWPGRGSAAGSDVDRGGNTRTHSVFGERTWTRGSGVVWCAVVFLSGGVVVLGAGPIRGEGTPVGGGIWRKGKTAAANGTAKAVVTVVPLTRRVAQQFCIAARVCLPSPSVCVCRWCVCVCGCGEYPLTHQTLFNPR